MDQTSPSTELRARIASCGPVSLRSDLLADPRAFKHVPLPLEGHLEAASDLVDVPDRYAVIASALRHLVVFELLPELPGVSVTLAQGPYNPVWARYVDGLSENVEALPAVSVEVPSGRVADVLVSALAGTLPPEPPPAAQPSAAISGMVALVGRRVQVTLASGGSERSVLSGRLVGVVYGDLVLDSDDELLTVVPAASVGYVATFQRTAAEDLRS